ncbi:MAG: ATP phosphoribosyltransferase [Chloroflexi bacterium]|nr:MAG: ATP phosphoribosyltransferase [Chloroflexota bacterium]
MHDPARPRLRDADASAASPGSAAPGRRAGLDRVWAHHRSSFGIDPPPVRHASGRGHSVAQPGGGTCVVASRRGGEPGALPDRIDGVVVGQGPAHEAAAPGAGGGATGRRPQVTPEDQVSIAVPTGVLLDGALALLAKSGLARLSAEELGRQLLIDGGALRVILVRPTDVPAYVDHGAADLGIVGKDILWETPGSHYELIDLRFGGCRLVLAVPDASGFNGPQTWPPMMRVATKYPRTAVTWFEARGQAVEVVRLHGSVELAPQVGLVDGIIDLTATGRTLRDNRLRIIAVLGSSTARLIANQASLKTRTAAVQSAVSRLREASGHAS